MVDVVVMDHGLYYLMFHGEEIPPGSTAHLTLSSLSFFSLGLSSRAEEDLPFLSYPERLKALDFQHGSFPLFLYRANNVSRRCEGPVPLNGFNHLGLTTPAL